MSNRKYTAEHLEFFRENTPGRTFKELTELFNKRFKTEYPVSTVMSASFRYGFKNGRDTKLTTGYVPTQFKKGHFPFNKGKKKWWVGGEETQFSKGHLPWNYKPVGTERINADGYVDVKIADPGKWKAKHVLIWEEANGAIPKGSVLLFADRNKLNVSLDNLILVTRGELARMNQKGYIFTNAELTKSGHIMAKLATAIGQKRSNHNGNK